MVPHFWQEQEVEARKLLRSRSPSGTGGGVTTVCPGSGKGGARICCSGTGGGTTGGDNTGKDTAGGGNTAGDTTTGGGITG